MRTFRLHNLINHKNEFALIVAEMNLAGTHNSYDT